jgi:hypothetical protein
MSIEFGLWRVDGSEPQRLELSGNDLERNLQQWLIKDLSIVAPELMLLGTEVHAFDNERIDLLAIDRAGKLYVLELKRGIARRDIVAQLLDYGAWVAQLELSELNDIFDKYCPNRRPEQTLDDAFKARFGESLPDPLDAGHELWMVISGMDERTEKLCNYLTEYFELPVNALFVHLIKDGERQYLARAWLHDPAQIAPTMHSASNWNREFYVNFGDSSRRSWEEARKFGFISAGGGTWYSRTLNLLSPGDRIWVRIPQSGYVGVGAVTSKATPVDDFKADVDGQQRLLIDVAPVIAKADRYADNPEAAEYVVGVDWMKTVPASQAIHEAGFFGNQNSVARPRAESWVKTVARLKQRFGISD